MASRVLVVGIGLVVLIILFVFIKGLLSGGGNKEAMLHVVQDQQEIIHLTKGAGQQQTISEANKNFAVTAQLSITSQQSQLKKYLIKQEHLKLNLKDINLKVSSTLDTNLANAAAASTYDSTFRDIMKAQLANYKTALSIAYKQTPGPNGQKLLKDDYTSASLLLEQLTAGD